MQTRVVVYRARDRHGKVIAAAVEVAGRCIPFSTHSVRDSRKVRRWSAAKWLQYGFSACTSVAEWKRGNPVARHAHHIERFVLLGETP